MAFLNLPAELILSIADQIPNKRDLSNLCQTCRDLRSILNNYIYRHDARSAEPQSLIWAAYKGHKAIARKALSNGVNIHAGDTSPSPFPDPFPTQSPYRRPDSCPATLNFSPLQIATCYGHENMVRFLLQHGADPHAPFPAHHGGYPLHVASCNGPPGLVRLLLEQGAEVDARTPIGWTPLYCAVRLLVLPPDAMLDNTLDDRKRGAVRIRLLLDYGADPDAMTRAGKSPRLLAKKCRDPYVRMMLLGGKGARVSLHEANLKGRSFRENPLLKERRVVLGAEVDNDLDNNSTSASMPPEAVADSISKRARKEARQNKQQRKKRLEAGEGDTKGTSEVKDVGAAVSAEASQRELEAKRGQKLPEPFCCVHQSGAMFRMKRKAGCGSCGNVTKRPFRCPDCEVVLCSQCVN
ncbi:ankyrin [Blastomyces parvus]|uniref:Ankyrin n=1 Tax=Blastomyces parvus TaxID=2060905 RepID=A0A2B7W6Y1_9EURO|nr:ankyrin [Blastomyces parvus]